MLPLYYQEEGIEAGCDEAGRGCFAGPVFAAAVILPRDFHHPLLNDSKQLPEKQRDELRICIEKEALAWRVAAISNEEIDRINILKASFKAMHEAISGLKIRPDLLLIDGNRFVSYPGIRHQCFIKGDGRFASIAAASILAKTHRDELMKSLHRDYPHYNWTSNKGYGTAEHRKAIETYGISPHHRKSFRLLASVEKELF